jgi:hypothetical protein
MESEFSFTGISKVIMTYEKGDTASTHIATKLRLDIPDNLSESIYLEDEGMPTKDGIKPLSITFIQGLVGSIHMADSKGWWKKEDHLQWVIEELKRSMNAEVAEISKDTF